MTAAMLAGLMAGCGSAEKNPVESSMAGESSEAQIGEESAGDSGEQAEETDLSGQEPYTVRIVADGFGSEEACAEIGAAVSEITKAKFNTEVEIVRYDFATYVDKVQTELASGEKIDLLGGVSQIPIPSAASQGQVIALNELLESDGQDILCLLYTSGKMCTSEWLNGLCITVWISRKKKPMENSMIFTMK